MASRRLTISSLLNNDPRSADSPFAGPSTAPPVLQARDAHPSSYAYSAHPATASSPIPYAHDSNSFPAVPLSLQASVSTLRRHTPSPLPLPEQSPAIPPSISRRSFKEIAWGDYHDSSSSTTRPVGDGSDHRTRRQSPEPDSARYSSHSRTSIGSLVHRHQPGTPPRSVYHTFDEPSFPPRGYSESFHVPQTEPEPQRSYARSASHSPVATFSSAHLRASQSPLLAATSSNFYSASYASHYSQPPSRSPVQILSPAAPPPTTPSAESAFTRHSPLVDSHYAPTLVKPTLSALLTHSPPPVTRASASSLPHILNSPIMARGQGMNYSAGAHSAITPGMEALEALAEVAAQERKRVQGGVDEGAGSGTSSRHSPIVLRMDVDASPHFKRETSSIPAQPSPPRSAYVPSARPSPLAERVPSPRVSPVVVVEQAPVEHASPVVDRAARESPVSSLFHGPRTVDGVDYRGRSRERDDSPMVSVDLAQPAHGAPPETKATSPWPVKSPIVEAVKSPVVQPVASSDIVSPVPPCVNDGEPPMKRRRSNPPESPPIASGDMQPTLAPVASERVASPPKSRSPVAKVEPSPAPLPPAEPPVAKPPTPKPQPTEPPPRPPSPKDLAPAVVSPAPPQHTDTPKEPVDKVPTKAASKQRKAKPKDKAEVKKRPAKVTVEKEKAASPTEKVVVEKPKVEEAVVEEDAHEWLLEHYGGPSPPTHPAAPAVVSRDKGPPATSAPGSRQPHKHEESSMSPVSTHHGPATSRTKPPHTTASKPKEARSKTRTPTPLALLEEELEDTTTTRRVNGASHTHDAQARGGHSSKAQEMDVDSELDLAVNDAYTRREDSAEMDVDAELLSLLDDQPRPSATKPAHSVPHSMSPLEQTHRRSASPAKTAHTPNWEETKEQGSMPPPPPATAHASKKKAETAAAGSKKKEPAEKAAPKKASVAPPTKAKPKLSKAAKPKQPPRKDGSATPAPVASTSSSNLTVPTINAPRNKKSSPLAATLANGLAAKRALSTGGASRSRSASVMPGADADKGEEDEEEMVDDRLYCICKTSYDEDRVMIACDRCDEWYHTSCVNMPDLEVDLVDQFICPICIAKNPNLPLKTTYKTRCFAGLNAPNPAAPEACHKPSRGVFSKYCSDDCGVKFVKRKIELWGGEQKRIWEAVKHAERRDGVVYRVVYDAQKGTVNGEGSRRPGDARMELVTPTKTQGERELDRLQAALTKAEEKRESMAKGQEVLQWREKVVDLAAARAERVQECGWDQRLCFGDEEVLEFGADVPETYEEDARRASPDADGMQVDGAVGEWWCRGKKKCDRHAGWQKLRKAELDLEREVQEAQLEKLTTQEREIRKKMEGVTETAARKPVSTVSGPLQPVNGDISKGMAKPQLNGVAKKGKKRKAES